MYRAYYDIISRISKPPLWWQEWGIPRYDEFDPSNSTALGTKEVALAEIACQATGTRFIVAFEGGGDGAIATAIRDFSLDYGDPPNVAGVVPHMLSETLRVLQYWYRGHPEYVVDGVITDWNRYDEWRRDPSLEVTFPYYDPNEVAIYWPRQSSDLYDESPPLAPPKQQWSRFLKRLKMLLPSR